jgi:predicted DNA-binding transcriptional regulator AlpA
MDTNESELADLPRFIVGEDKMTALVGVSDRSTLRDWESRGEFPKRVKLGKGRVGWPVVEYRAWAKAKMEAR